MGIFRGKHTFREEAARGAGGGRRRLAVRGPPGPPDQPNKKRGARGLWPRAPRFSGREAPSRRPPGPLGNRPRQKGGRFAGLGDGSRLPGGLLAIVRSGGGGVRRPGRGGGGLGSGPPEGENAPLIA